MHPPPPPAAPPSDLHKLALIDVSLEDDSLLPFQDTLLLRNDTQLVCQDDYSSGTQSSSKASQELHCVHEESSESQASSDPDPKFIAGSVELHPDMQPMISDEPGLVNRKKRSAHFNLRKSLAWNSAFLTEEGVLDPEELSLVNKTFKKPLDIRKPEVSKKGKGSYNTARYRAGSTQSCFDKSDFNRHEQRMDANFSPHGQEMALSYRNSLQTPSPCSSSGSIPGSGAEMMEQNGSKYKAPASYLQTQNGVGRHRSQNVKPAFTIGLGYLSSKAAPSQIAVDTGSQKGSPLHFPSSFSKNSGGQGIVDLRNTVTKKNKDIVATIKSSPSSISNLSKKMASVSRKMKDKIGKVLPSHANNQKEIAATMQDLHTIPSSPNSSGSSVAESAKLTRCHSYTSFERFGRSTFEAVPGLACNLGFNCQPSSIECDRDHDYSLKGAADGQNSSTSSHSSSSPACVDVDLEGKHCSSGKGSMDASHSTINLPHQELSERDSSIQKVSRIISSSSFPKSCSKETGNVDRNESYPVRPSGLRKPSPKLGFFDGGRTLQVPHLPILPESSRSLALDRKSGHAEKRTFLSRFANDGMSKNNLQHSMKGKYQGISLNQASCQASEVSGLSIHKSCTSSNIPLAPHLRRLETASKGSLPSVAAHVSQVDPLSAKAFSGQSCDFRQLASYEKGPSILDIKKDQGQTKSLKSLKVVPYTKRPFTKNLSTVKVGQEPLSFGARRLSQQSSTDSSDSCESYRSHQKSVPACSGMLVSSNSEITRSGDHQPFLNKDIIDARETSLTQIPEFTSGKGSEIGDFRDISSPSGNGLCASQDSRFLTNDLSPGVSIEAIDSSHISQLGDSLHDIVYVGNQARENDISLRVSKSAETFGAGKSSMLNILGDVGEPVHRTPGLSNGQTFTAISSACESVASSPADSLLHVSNFLVSKTDDVNSPKAVFQESCIRSPLGSNTVNVAERQIFNQFKEKGSIFSFAKKAVSRLTLSPREHSEQENRFTEGQGGAFIFHKLSCSKSACLQQSALEMNNLVTFPDASPLSGERFCVLEAPNEEMVQKKNGVMKHFSPDNTCPEPGPYSLVHKDGQQLRSFDCTKCVNTNSIH